MKQVSFVVEVVLTEENPTIIIRDTRGSIVKITNKAAEMTSFLDEVVDKFSQVPASNPS